MGRFFDLFPTTRYSFSDSKYPNYQLATNILFRTSFIKEVLNNTSAYLTYTIKDSDTPEILASKIYKDPSAHWIILYANEILDPQFQWPLNSTSFFNYMVDKYRVMAENDDGGPLEDYEVVAWTQNTTNPASIHHYEKIIKRDNQAEQTITESRYIINKDRLTDNALTVPHDYYDALPDEQGVTPINLEVDGQTIIETVYRNAVTYYDYELELNESRRFIKIVKNEYYPQIVKEFERLTNNSVPTFFRRVS